MALESRRLNIACGNDHREGFVNVDRSPSSRADIQLDLFTPNWSDVLGHEQYDYVLISHFMEHVPRDLFPTFMANLWRCCQPGAVVEIVSPHWSSDNFHTDPTHCLPISLRTFDFFDPEKPLYENGQIYGWTASVRFRVKVARIIDNPPNGPDVLHRLVALK